MVTVALVASNPFSSFPPPLHFARFLIHILVFYMNETRRDRGARQRGTWGKMMPASPPCLSSCGPEWPLSPVPMLCFSWGLDICLISTLFVFLSCLHLKSWLSWAPVLFWGPGTSSSDCQWRKWRTRYFICSPTAETWQPSRPEPLPVWVFCAWLNHNISSGSEARKDH